IALAILASYLLGATPTSYIAGKVRRGGGSGLRGRGGQNVGATTVVRTLGGRYAVHGAPFAIPKGALRGVFFLTVFAAAVGGAGARAGCARVEASGRYQRLSDPRLEVRDSGRTVRHRQGRDCGAVLLQVGRRGRRGRRGGASVAPRRPGRRGGPRPHVLPL